MPSTSSSCHPPYSSSSPHLQPLVLAPSSTPPPPQQQPSITHTALTNPDILDLILENLAIPCLWDLTSSLSPSSSSYSLASSSAGVPFDGGDVDDDDDDDDDVDIRGFEEMRGEEIVKRRGVLLNVALTNKAIFLEPGLDRLWRSLDKLFPLFRLLRGFYRSDSTFVSSSFCLKAWVVD
jgi:hypothetical protein